MICREASQFGSQLSSAEWHDLVCMHLDGEPCFLGGREHASGLFVIEYALLGEDVAALGQILSYDFGQYFAAEVLDEFGGTSFVFGRSVMCSHEGGVEVEGLLVLQVAHYAQLLQLRLEVHPVSALGLYGGDAHLHHIGEVPSGRCFQLVFRFGTCSAHGAGDPSAALHDTHVAVAGEPPLELIFPVAAEDEMSVAVHKARQYAASRGVQLPAAFGHGRGYVRHAAGKGDDAVADNYCGRAFDGVYLPHGFAAVFGFGALAGDELGDILDVEVHCVGGVRHVCR